MALSPGALLLVVAVYLGYSGWIYGIERLFAHQHPLLAVLAAVVLHLVNWLVAAMATSGHEGRLHDALWLALCSVVPFAGGAGLVAFGSPSSVRLAGWALMGGSFVPTGLFLVLLLRRRFPPR